MSAFVVVLAFSGDFSICFLNQVVTLYTMCTMSDMSLM